jgi:redox-sensitive transcriptional activator SoxR
VSRQATSSIELEAKTDSFIVFAQRIGLTLGEIAEQLSRPPPNRAPTRSDWSRLSNGWTARIDERIAELERLRAGLTECIGCGCLSLDRCQLATPGTAWVVPARARATGSAIPGRPSRIAHVRYAAPAG